MQAPESPVKENPNIKNVLDIESFNKPFGVEEAKFGLIERKQNKALRIYGLTSEVLKL